MIIIKSDKEITLIRKACQLTKKVLEESKQLVKIGMSTLDLDTIIEDLIKKYGGEPAFKGYRTYKHASCISINHEVVHGIPKKETIIKKGDIVSIDVGLNYKGFIGDCATTIIMGEASSKVKKLLEITESALMKGIEQAICNNFVGDIGHAIEDLAKKNNFGIIRDLFGHGVGTAVHEDPLIPNFGKPKTGPRLKKGMTIAIEPMFTLGSGIIDVLDDGWTIVTKDKKIAAHFEHTILITDDKPEILTVI